MPCSGASFNSTQICGGVNRLSVYKDRDYILPEIVNFTGEWMAQGCWTEGETERTLDSGDMTVDPEGMTVEFCTSYCEDLGYNYAGVEYAEECWCGDHLSTETEVVSDDECNMKCTGDRKTFCGGPNRMVLYQKDSMQERPA
jgi:hypothetical protein